MKQSHHKDFSVIECLSLFVYGLLAIKDFECWVQIIFNEILLITHFVIFMIVNLFNYTITLIFLLLNYFCILFCKYVYSFFHFYTVCLLLLYSMIK